jgi:DNA-binding NtrC family response regulator
MATRIFVVDDEPKMGTLFQNVLERDGYEVTAFVHPASLVEAVDDGADAPDVVLTDMTMPGMTGIELMNVLHKRGFEGPVIIMAAQASVQTAVRAMRQGAFHYLEKPINLEAMRSLLSTAVQQHSQDRGEVTPAPGAPAQGQYPIENILGESAPIVQVRDTIRTLRGVPNTTVLFTGETGTGKNLAARTLHSNSPRAAGRFTDIDCASLPGNLLEAELFGYEEGAFTDAREAKKGLIEVADEGTLFLDEIDSMSLALQAKLLSFLESRTFRRLGGVENRSADVRVLCATNADLTGRVQDGDFRKDLFFRINVVNVRLPPLRRMGDDVLLIARRTLEEVGAELNVELRGFTEAAEQKLHDHPWPGNVRELRNVIERAMIFAEGRWIGADDLSLAPPEYLRAGASSTGAFRFELGRTLEAVEREYIRRTLETRTNDSYANIADDLGISKKTLWEKRKRYELDALVDR